MDSKTKMEIIKLENWVYHNYGFTQSEIKEAVKALLKALK